MDFEVLYFWSTYFKLEFCRIHRQKNQVRSKGTFLSESNDVFVIIPNRQTFFFPETENLNFGDFYGCPSQPKTIFLPLQVFRLSNFKTSSIYEQFSVTKNSNFQFQERKMFVCLELWLKHQYLLTKTYLYGVRRNPFFKNQVQIKRERE